MWYFVFTKRNDIFDSISIIYIFFEIIIEEVKKRNNIAVEINYNQVDRSVLPHLNFLKVVQVNKPTAGLYAGGVARQWQCNQQWVVASDSKPEQFLDQSALAHAHTNSSYVVSPRSPVAADRCCGLRFIHTPSANSSILVDGYWSKGWQLPEHSPKRTISNHVPF